MTISQHRPRGHHVMVDNCLCLHKTNRNGHVGESEVTACTVSTYSKSHIVGIRMIWQDDSEDTCAMIWVRAKSHNDMERRQSRGWTCHHALTHVYDCPI